MPYRKRPVKRQKKPRYKRSKLADKKINTLVEKRMEQIAKKESKKARAKTYKDFELGSYSNDGQIASVVAVTGNADGTLLNIFELPAYDEDSSKSTVSKRLGDFAWIRGFKVEGVLRMPASNSDMQEQLVRLAVFSQRRQIDPLSSQILTDLPTPALYNDLNGSPKDEDQKDDYSKIKVHKSIVCKLSPKGKYLINKHFSFSHYFKKPIKQQWEPADLGGTNPMKHAYFFAAYADKGSETNSESPVQICCNVRMYYFTE